MARVVGAMMWDVERHHLRWRAVGGAVAAIVSLAACSGDDTIAGVESTGQPANAATSDTAEPETETPAPTLTTPSSGEATPEVVDATAPDSVAAATGSGVAVYEDDQYEFDVVACGWMAGDADPDQQLASTPDDRRLFHLVGVGRSGDALFLVGLSWDGRTGNVEASAGHTGSPTFLASSGLNATSSVEIDDKRITTVRPLTVREGDDVAARHLEVDATCDRFGGSFGSMEQLLEQATGQQVTSPEERGGSGTLVIDGEELAVEVESCDDRDVVVTVQASAHDGTWLYVMAADSAPDEVVVGREGDRTGSDATGDLIERDGDRLTSSGPIMLSDRIDDTPAETVTLDVSCT